MSGGIEWSWPGDNDLAPRAVPSPVPTDEIDLPTRMLNASRAAHVSAGDIWRGAGSALGQDLYNLGAGFYNTARDVIMGPGQILAGERSPIPYSLNYIDPTEYALKMASLGAGIRAPSLLTRGGAFDPATMPSFFAWHGTGAKEPFPAFERGQLRGQYGEGSSPYAWNNIGFGHGFYFGQMKGTGEYYARQQGGSLLNVFVKPDEHELLDMDLPFLKQHEQVRQRMTAAGLDPADHDITGFNHYANLVTDYMKYNNTSLLEAERHVSGLLEDAGIPGTKYLDLHSRGKSVAPENKTRNFVIFNPADVEIRSWNGRPLMPVEHDPFAGAE